MTELHNYGSGLERLPLCVNANEILVCINAIHICKNGSANEPPSLLANKTMLSSQENVSMQSILEKI